MNNDIPLRAFLYLFVFGLAYGLPGILLDVDHGVALVVGIEDARWFHNIVKHTTSAFILYSLCWGAIICTFVLGWVAFWRTIVSGSG